MICHLTRRACLSGLAAGALAGTSARAATGQAADSIHAHGCILGPHALGAMRAHVVEGGEAQAQFSTLARTTGNGTLDRAFDASLKRIADLYGVFPSFDFIDDKDAPNAFADPVAMRPERTGGVYFGINLFRQLMATDPSGVSVLGVVAHEFAHVWQFQSGYFEALVANQPTVKRAELGADYIAGFFLGERKLVNPDASLFQFGRKLWSFGDYGADVNHHGTPAERIAAAQAGFKLSFSDHLQDIAAAFQDSLTYVATK